MIPYSILIFSTSNLLSICANQLITEESVSHLTNLRFLCACDDAIINVEKLTGLNRLTEVVV